MSKWLPIETAPLDGTPVDLWAVRGMCGDLGYRSGERYTDCRFARPSFGTEPYGEPRWIGLNDRHIKVTPTHWMPVPECPSPSVEDIQAKDAEIACLRDLIRWAHDTLYEINPSNYDHDEVCKINDASVEVILGLAPTLGERHGKSVEWWAERAEEKADV